MITIVEGMINLNWLNVTMFVISVIVALLLAVILHWKATNYINGIPRVVKRKPNHQTAELEQKRKLPLPSRE